MDEDLPTHRRTITVESYERDGQFEVHARLRDERPWAKGTDTVEVLHEMGMTLRVDPATMTITDARAEMSNFPHEECRSIEPAFRGLVGLSVTRGYNRELQARLGRERGCSHLEFLARAVGPAVIQSAASARGRRGGNRVSEDDRGTFGTWLTNTCHLWSEGGVGAEKVRLGWRPGVTAYPTPSLVEIRRRERDGV